MSRRLNSVPPLQEPPELCERLDVSGSSSSPGDSPNMFVGRDVVI